MNTQEQEWCDKVNAALGKIPRVKTHVQAVKLGNTFYRCYLQTEPSVKETHVRGYVEFLARELRLKTLPAVYSSFSEGAIVLDIPNEDRTLVQLEDCLESSEFKERLNNKIGLPYVIGIDNDGRVICGDLTQAPHVLIAGQSGSGKSMIMRVILNSLLAAWASAPKRCQYILIDPKGVELVHYKELENVINYTSNNEEAIEVFLSLVALMESRYEKFSEINELMGQEIYNIDDYNLYRCKLQKNYTEAMPYIVVMIDELSDILLNSPEAEDALLRLTQKARAAGIHLVMATQRPSREIISGPIRANVPTKICCKVARAVDGRVVFGDHDHEAHRLLGKGDLLYIDESHVEPVRIQGAYTDVSYLREYEKFVKNGLRDNVIIPFSSEPAKRTIQFKQHSFSLKKCLYG